MRTLSIISIIIVLIVFIAFPSIKNSLNSGYKSCDALVEATKTKDDIRISSLISYSPFCTSDQRILLVKYKANQLTKHQ